ncbi:MAG: ATP-dependent helicase [Chloroflexaceae bacterium]|nr:ATP-dependent helicase [Chloroflexaceae bacterium]
MPDQNRPPRSSTAAAAPTPALRSGIHDNRSRGCVGDFLRDHIQPGAALSIVSAYFTIYAFHALKDRLLPIAELRFLYGEPHGLAALDPERNETKAFDIVDSGLTLSNRLQQREIARACADWIREKVTIRSITRAGLLHGKLYHIAYASHDEALVGSSNFTLAGLGLAPVGNNIELNLEVDSTRDRHDLRAWFDELWQDQELVEDVTAQVLADLARLYADNAPQFIYYKTLFHLFGAYLAQQQQYDLLTAQPQLADTAIWQALFEFQRDGVRGAINKILAHNGCIIADSVGLGKTYEALAIIKYFELRNARVLVLCPKKLRENWTVYQAQNNSPLNPFLKDRFSYTVLSHTDLSRERGTVGDIDLSLINWGNYDLVVIDESHNFRNNTAGKRDATGNVIRRSRYQRLMEDIIRSGIKTNVLLLSATPVNNDLSDLRNQLAFLAAGDEAAFQKSLGISSLSDTLATAQRTFNEWAKQSAHRDPHALLNRLGSGLFTLLDGLTIARSRKHIKTYYSATLHQLGGFPQRQKPLAVVADTIDQRGRFMPYDRLYDEISAYRLALFNPSAYVLPQYQARYEHTRVRNFRQSTREHFLIGMMRVNFLKRLESSIHAFTLTLERTISKIEVLEQRIARFQQQRHDNPDLDFDSLLIEDVDDDELQAALQVGTVGFKMAHLDTDRWRTDLQSDKQQLSLVYTAAKDVTPERDTKLAQLRALIARKVQQPTTTRDGMPNRKVLVFTAFADTARYLYEQLQHWAHTELGIHCALVTGDGNNRTTLGMTDFTHILANFAPRAKQRAQLPSLPQDAELDLLIATDCISEGQNLQDCDYLVNYDIHWNPVRIIQRFGRIDRIGSPNTSIQLVNFWPTHDLNKYINLKNRVEARMALVDITATGHDNLLADAEELATQELSYRDQQLLRLKDEVLDLEDLNESLTLNEFTLDDFRMDLVRYIESNRKRLEDAPLGLYAVVPPHPDYPICAPGIIYCLRHKEAGQATTINPLQPFYLVYVRDTGEVRLNFAQPKQILELYRLLCADQPAPYDALCRLFDRRTADGTEMQVANDLLQHAVQSITTTFQRRVAAHMLSGRGALLPDVQEQVHTTTDFELVTWLVIQAEE